MAFNVPGMLLNGFVALVYLICVFQIFPRLFNRGQAVSIGNTDNVARVLKNKYRALGPMNFHEIGVAILFFFVVMLWFFRDPRFIDGWAESLHGAEVGDSSAAMFIIFLLFIIPKKLDFSLGKGEILYTLISTQQITEY